MNVGGLNKKKAMILCGIYIVKFYIVQARLDSESGIAVFNE